MIKIRTIEFSLHLAIVLPQTVKDDRSNIDCFSAFSAFSFSSYVILKQDMSTKLKTVGKIDEITM